MDANLLMRIYRFNKEVVQIGNRPLESLGVAEKTWLRKALGEESQEFQDAKTAVEGVDALADTIVFAVGGLFRMGLSPDQVAGVLHIVMDANFEKKAGVKSSRAVEGVADAIKPEGFVPPEDRITDFLFFGRGRTGTPETYPSDDLGKPLLSLCEARQYSDQMVCNSCNLVWDMNDPNPPECEGVSE